MSDAPSTPAPAATNAPAFTVSELSGAIKRALEDGFGYVRLRGEISGFKGPHASGHSYFALKDDKAKIETVIWRGVAGKLGIKPEEGLEVIVQGRVTTFPGSSKYQIVIETMEPAGAGALMALLAERRKRLAAEGLFDDARKRKLPFLPRVAGIVTSPTGAVIRDILACFNERFPTRVIVWPVRVQGDTCAAEVASAIQGFNALPEEGPLPRPDVIIVARGGGSLEDLWGFNEEIVARAAAGSTIPLISAVGHETDWTLIDLAADARAPTPTKAAEWAVPKYSDLAEGNTKLALRLIAAMRRALEARRSLWKAASRGLPRLEQLLALPRQHLDACDGRLTRGLLANTRSHAIREARLVARFHPRLLAARVQRGKDRLDAVARRGREEFGRHTNARRKRFERARGGLQLSALIERLAVREERLRALAERGGRGLLHGIQRQRRRLDASAGLLGSLGYQRVLRRGYALVRDARGRMVRHAAAIAVGDALEIEFRDGRVPVETRDRGRTMVDKGTSEAKSRASISESPSRKPRGSGQGTLF